MNAPVSAISGSEASADSALQEYLRDGRISRELVEKVADIVYAMLLEESYVDRERRRMCNSIYGRGWGGW